jgi:hypothetical protein
MSDTRHELREKRYIEGIETEERSANDPFGFKEIARDPRRKNDRWAVGKEVADRATRIFALVVAELMGSPEQFVFGVELAALNVFNADNIPLTPEQIKEARDAAFEYYVKMRSKA